MLDLGCGPGRDVEHLTELGCWVVGLDLSSGMLAEARRNLPTVLVVRADLRDPPFASSSFEGIWACASLLHLARSQLPNALLGLGRLLRQSSGVLYLALKVGQGESWSANRSGCRSFFSFYQPPEITTALAEAGFQVLEDWVAPDKGGRDRPWLNVIARMQG